MTKRLYRSRVAPFARAEVTPIYMHVVSHMHTLRRDVRSYYRKLRLSTTVTSRLPIATPNPPQSEEAELCWLHLRSNVSDSRRHD